MAQWLKKKNLPVMQETQEMQIQSLGLEDPLEEEMVTHSSTLAQKTPWTEDPGGLQSKGLQRVGHSLATEHSKAQLNNKESSNAMKECAERS